jgi:hypothetical protein
MELVLPCTLFTLLLQMHVRLQKCKKIGPPTCHYPSFTFIFIKLSSTSTFYFIIVIRVTHNVNLPPITVLKLIIFYLLLPSLQSDAFHPVAASQWGVLGMGGFPCDCRAVYHPRLSLGVPPIPGNPQDALRLAAMDAGDSIRSS